MIELFYDGCFLCLQFVVEHQQAQSDFRFFCHRRIRRFLDSLGTRRTLGHGHYLDVSRTGRDLGCAEKLFIFVDPNFGFSLWRRRGLDFGRCAQFLSDDGCGHSYIQFRKWHVRVRRCRCFLWGISRGGCGSGASGKPEARCDQKDEGERGTDTHSNSK